MSTSTEITRLQTARNTIRTKLVDLGLAQSTSKLDALATAVEGITNQGAVNAQVTEGATYTIPKGYHNGSGVVSGVAGGGNYSLQEKSVTPTKSQQNVTADSGYYGLAAVTVGAIPENFNDTSSVTAGAADVLANKVIVAADGTTVAGTMPNNGAVAKTLNTTTTSYTVPKGYHNGSGKVSISTETKSATPTKAAQDITPSSGKVLSKVTVAAIPDNYIDTTDADAVAEDIRDGMYAYVDGAKIEGTMPDNGALTVTLDTTNTSCDIGKGYHNGNGKISITNEAKSAYPTKDIQYITPTSGKVLSQVTVEPIPDEYHDVSSVTATADRVFNGDIFVDATGAQVEGTMTDNGATTKTLDTATTSYTIAKGYHNGNGKVSITTETKSATPTKSSQTIKPSTGKVLSQVTVAAIPANYIDTTDADATAANILDGKFAYVGGEKIEGTMANNGAVSKTLNTTTTSYTVPAGYHSGTGKVSITTETKSATPTKSAQTITPTTGKVLSSVSVAAIPAAYQDVTGVTAAATDVLDGKVIVNSSGAKVTGSMANNGDVTATMDGLTTTSVTIPAGYTSGGTVSLTSDIEEALAAI